MWEAFVKQNFRFLFILAATLALTYLLSLALRPRDSSTTSRPAAETIAPSVRLVPAKLLAGELERLRPHLRLTATGFFRAEITGRDVMIGSDWELWKDGKRSQELGSHLTRTEAPAEVSYSLQAFVNHEGKKKFSLVDAITGATGGTHTTEFDQPESFGTTMSGTAEIREPVVLPEGESVLIWAYLIHNDMKRPVLSPIEDAVKNSRWALVVKARWERPETSK